MKSYRLKKTPPSGASRVNLGPADFRHIIRVHKLEGGSIACTHIGFAGAGLRHTLPRPRALKRL